MKFIKEWSEWNPVLNKKVLDFIEINKTNLKNIWNDDMSEEENIKFLVDYFTEYPDEMNSSINIDNIKTLYLKAT
jgi:peroxiredoxin